MFERRHASYAERDWVAQKIEIRPSKISGKGMFAKEPIASGEKMVVLGGLLFTREDIRSGRAAPSLAIDENLYLSGFAGEVCDTDFINHSCDPNAWLEDEITFSARRAVAAGAELTVDYAVFLEEESHRSPWSCNCGSSLCRRKVTGKDWRIPELQSRYEGHFSPFINKRIAILGGLPGASQGGRKDISNYFDVTGRLKVWPKKFKNGILGYLAGRFEAGRSFSEAEVNEILKGLHTFDDHALLRRELCDRGFLARKDDGSSYWRKEGISG